MRESYIVVIVIVIAFELMLFSDCPPKTWSVVPMK